MPSGTFGPGRPSSRTQRTQLRDMPPDVPGRGIDPDLGVDLGDREVWARQIAYAKLKKGRKLDPRVNLERAITNIQITDTMEGSSTVVLSLYDDDGDVAAVFDMNTDGKLDQLDVNWPEGSKFWWRLTQVGIDLVNGGWAYTLTFMERAACHLMLHTKPQKARRGQKTRAEFLQQLTDVVGRKKGSRVPEIRFRCKELRVDQAVAGPGGGGGFGGTGVQVTGSLLDIGDSIAVGTRDALDKAIKNKIRHITEGSQPTAWGLTQAQAQAKLPPTLLVQLGTNDTDVGAFRNGVQGFKALDGVERIFWVNISRPVLLGTPDSALNDVLRQEANEKLQIINWKRLVTSGGVDLPDNIHVFGAEAAKRAKLIKQALTGDSSGTSRPPAGSGKRDGDDGPNAASSSGDRIETKWKKLRSGQTLTDVECAQLWVDAGGTEPDSYIAAAMAFGESGRIVGRYNSICCYGIWQINANAHGQQYSSQAVGAEWDRAKKAVAIRKASPDAWGINPWEACQDAACSPYVSEAAAIETKVKEAGGLDAAATGGGDGDDVSGRTYRKAYHFTVGGPNNRGENYWDAMRRLADEVNWALFLDGQNLYFEDENVLVAQKPVDAISRGGTAVVGFRSNWDVRRIATECEIDLVCNAFEYRAGQVLQLTGFGPASGGSTARPEPLPGRWLISEITREKFDLVSTLKLKQPEREKLEPAPEVVTRPGQDPGGGNAADGDFGGTIDTSGGAKSIVDSCARIAAQVSDQNYVGSDYRPGSITSSGNASDHGSNDANQAARDIGHQGIDLLVGPPHRSLDLAVVAIGEEFGKDYGDGRQTIIDTFTWKGYRVQIIWRTPLYGGHMGHIHVGVRR